MIIRMKKHHGSIIEILYSSGYIIKNLSRSCGASYALIRSYGRYIYFSFLYLCLDGGEQAICMINTYNPDPASHTKCFPHWITGFWENIFTYLRKFFWAKVDITASFPLQVHPFFFFCTRKRDLDTRKVLQWLRNQVTFLSWVCVLPSASSDFVLPCSCLAPAVSLAYPCVIWLIQKFLNLLLASVWRDLLKDYGSRAMDCLSYSLFFSTPCP